LREKFRFAGTPVKEVLRNAFGIRGGRNSLPAIKGSRISLEGLPETSQVTFF